MAKLNAYETDIPSSKPSYLTTRKQKKKLNGTHSSWPEIIFGVPQGSILGQLPFNIFRCDLFQFSPDLLPTTQMITLSTQVT